MTTQNDDRCLNCQATLEGPYCSQCGQAKSARLIPFKEWVSDFLETFIDFDSKMLKTLKSILFHPGQATLDFAEGRRVSFSGPARVYIVVSAVSIAAMTLHGVFDASIGMLTSGLDASADFQKRISFLFPILNLLSPFLPAGILALVQRKQLFQLHLAFSLHFWTYLVVIWTPPIFFPQTSIWSLVAYVGVSLLSVGYLFMALRRVYAMPMLKRLAVCGAVMASVPLASILFMLLIFMLALMLS